MLYEVITGLVSSSVRDFCLGQAYFVAGWMYVELAYHYGDDKMGVPILNEEDPKDYFRPREANVQANYDYAMDLLQKAEQLLPYVTELSSEDLGRPHKDAATAYMAKIALYTKKWSDVVTYADKVIGSPSGRGLIVITSYSIHYTKLYEP